MRQIFCLENNNKKRDMNVKIDQPTQTGDSPRIRIQKTPDACQEMLLIISDAISKNIHWLMRLHPNVTVITEGLTKRPTETRSGVVELVPYQATIASKNYLVEIFALDAAVTTQSRKYPTIMERLQGHVIASYQTEFTAVDTSFRK